MTSELAQDAPMKNGMEKGGAYQSTSLLESFSVTSRRDVFLPLLSPPL
jgi:hypothetical protein